MVLTLEQTIRKRIINLAKEKKLSINKVSIPYAMPHTTLLLFMNNKMHDLKITTLLNMCKAFNILLNNFFITIYLRK